MTALSSKSGEWQTPPWLVEKCRAALGGYITLDAATTDANPVGASWGFTKEVSALANPWGLGKDDTLFLNPPGDKSGTLIRKFWALWDRASRTPYTASVWVDFNLDHLRFLTRVPGDCLIVPRKRLAFVDPTTGKEKRGAQVGGFIYFRGYFGCTEGGSISRLFPEEDFLVMWGES